ncbi:MAG TPA: histidine kinase dimerization/phospho-acceptor domain-containing protein, partial [Vitreimonas sp.]|nr:histidine kinase dimerization/phospho-acceptor domain-containing protein [Vitreimonas sp.]
MTPVDEPSLERPVPDGVRSAASSQLILDIATAAAGERELDQILHETLDRLGAVVPLTGGSIALVEGDHLVIRAAIGPFAGEALGQRLRHGPSRSWRVVEMLEPFLSGDVHSEGLRATGARAAAAIRSWLGVPIVRRGHGIGLLEIDSTEPSAFDHADVELLSTVVQVLSGPIELASHYADERRAAALREAFIGVISHELRTPITTIYGLTKMLRQRIGSLAPDVRDQALGDVEAEADRLYRLVEDLLVLSRAEQGRVEIADEPLLVDKVIRHAVNAEAARWPGRTFHLDTQPSLPLVLGEPTYVEQVARNLLSNAAKYSPMGSMIGVSIVQEDGEVIVRVRDAGIGLSPGDEGR